MYKIKQVPNDFVVKEQLVLDDSPGQFFYYLLKKVDCTTSFALKAIAEQFSLQARSIGFAGNKDKCAVTEQFVSLKKKILDWQTERFSLTFVQSSSKPISLGTNEGNHFEIVVRNLDDLPEIKNAFLNTFGEQRFSDGNVAIGRSLVKKDYKSALDGVLAQNHEVKKVKASLACEPNNLVTALKFLPHRFLLFYVHSFQSFLWNKLAKKLGGEEFLPLLGFGTEFENELVEKECETLLKEEGLSLRDFVNRQIPELSVEGASRRVKVTAENLFVGKLENDELNDGKKKVLLSFFLPSGAYATEFVRQNFE